MGFSADKENELWNIIASDDVCYGWKYEISWNDFDKIKLIK